MIVTINMFCVSFSAQIISHLHTIDVIKNMKSNTLCINMKAFVLLKCSKRKILLYIVSEYLKHFRPFLSITELRRSKRNNFNTTVDAANGARWKSVNMPRHTREA